MITRAKQKVKDEQFCIKNDVIRKENVKVKYKKLSNKSTLILFTIINFDWNN